VLGQLGGKVEACIRGALASEDGRLDSSTRQALSRLLIVQADHGDRTKLLGALAWHLEHVSRGDADVSSRYALLLPEEPPEAVVEWCTRALEVLPRELEGDAYLTRRDALLARIARASTRIWIHTEARFQADRSDVNEALEREARANAKGSALEWRDFREAAGIPDKHEALALFNSANGHAEGGETR
jgi:hypothetical protein